MIGEEMKKTSQARLNKQKGKLGQNQVRDILLTAFPELERDDIISNPMGNPGEDLLLSPKARKLIPWNIEVKRKKKIAASQFIAQAKEHGDYAPVAIYRQDHQKEWHAIVELSYLLELIKQST